MKPESPSPWITSTPGGTTESGCDSLNEGPSRLWLWQPAWFSGPLLLGALLLPAAAWLNYTHGTGKGALGSVLLAASVVLAVLLVLLTHSARMTLGDRGITIRKLAADQFIPYRQISLLRTYERGSGRHRERFLEISLRSGEPLELDVGDPARMSRSIRSCMLRWERTLDDDEQAGEPARDREGGPYRESSGR